jgi:sugar phosphate isomerase/epimerase
MEHETRGKACMILSRLGVLTDEVSNHFTEALEWCARRGLRHVEIRSVEGTNIVDLPPAEAGRLSGEIRKRGFSVAALATPLFKCALDPSRKTASGDLFGAREESVEAHFSRLPGAFRIARELGTRSLRIFSFWRELEPRRFMADVARQLRRAAETAEREGMELLLENETACNGGYADEVAEIIERVDSPALRVLWDPGNETFGGRVAFPDGYGRVMDFVAHVHLKDVTFDGEGKPRCVPIGSGRTDLKGQIAALERNGYGGVYTVETRYVPEGGTAMQGTEMTFEGLEKILKEANLL